MCSMLKPNEGKTDRVIRILLGVILLGLSLLSLTGTTQIIVFVVGAVALLTGAIGFCGIYKILGISTLEKK